MSRVCHLCGTRNARKLCGGCKTTYYCNTTCQGKDWKEHKLVCKEHYLEKCNPIIETLVTNRAALPKMPIEKDKELYELGTNSGAYKETIIRLGHDVKLGMHPVDGYFVIVKGYPKYIIGPVRHMEQVAKAIDDIVQKHKKPINGYDAIVKMLKTMWTVMGSPDPNDYF